MKKTIIILLIVFPLILTSFGFAKSGKRIPIPKITMNEACNMATDYLNNKETNLIDSNIFKAMDYILTTAKYTNYINNKIEKSWSWVITFIHPEQNDHSVVYKITDDKEVVFLYATE